LHGIGNLMILVGHSPATSVPFQHWSALERTPDRQIIGLFENVLLIEQLRRQSSPWRQIDEGRVRAAQVFHLQRTVAVGGAD
jgi:hypothetical protein